MNVTNHASVTDGHAVTRSPAGRPSRRARPQPHHPARSPLQQGDERVGRVGIHRAWFPAVRFVRRQRPGHHRDPHPPAHRCLRQAATTNPRSLDQTAVVMLNASPCEPTPTRANTASRASAQHNHVLDINPNVTVPRHSTPLTLVQTKSDIHFQWANSLGARSSNPSHQRLNRLNARNRLYFRRAHRTR